MLAPGISPQAPLDRALAVLTFIAEQRKAVSAAEVADALSFPLPTARLLGNFEERGLVQRAAGTKRYMVGKRLVVLAGCLALAWRVADRSAPLRQLVAIARRLARCAYPPGIAARSAAAHRAK